jgi:hypothetical protein
LITSTQEFVALRESCNMSKYNRAASEEAPIEVWLEVGRFVSKDPIGLAGGLNLHQYAANAVEWVDPLELAKTIGIAGRQPQSENPNQNAKCECRSPWKVDRFDRICGGACTRCGTHFLLSRSLLLVTAGVKIRFVQSAQRPIVRCACA